MADTKPTEVKEEDVVVAASTVRGEDGKEYVAEVDPKSVSNFPIVDSFDTNPKLVVEPAPVEEEAAPVVGEKDEKVVDKE